jgi:hypothetical protein
VTDRQRYLETLLFGKPDRIPFQPGAPRKSTLEAWHRQGLPEGTDWQVYLRETIGIEPASSSGPGVYIRHQMIPEFEEKVIEERDDSLIVQDWKGNICEISKKYDVSYLRGAKDFVTRRWIKCPVENWEDWEQMKSRYDPEDPSRVPANIADLGRQIAKRDYVVGVHLNGPFWQLREWLGFENLCMLFIDDPALIRDMIRFWRDFVSKLLLKVLPYVNLDYVLISEDMAYKHKSMISPEMVRDFLAPCYQEWNEIIRSYGCPIFDVDSDGYIAELIPIWIECGLNCCDPIEVAAGNDINAYRETFGNKMAYRGGVDKRAIAKGGEAIRRELQRIEPVVRSGGYIPGCDHAIPPDVSLNAMIEYCDLLARMTGWK